VSAPDGVLPLLKPPGPSSHQVVSAVRRLVGSGVRIGHAGTLDPGAAGVLPLCVGGATRLAEYLHIPLKAYRFELVLGQETDTQDATGRVVGGADAGGLRRSRIEEALRTFAGPVRQRVPLYSARRHDGIRLYEYARRGVDAPRPDALVHIESLALLDWHPGNPARALCDVRCSSGTYVRSLCADIGSALGVGAHMGHLVRHAAGGLDAGACITLEELEAAAQDALWTAHCIAPADALGFLPALTVDPAEARALGNGRPPGRRRAGPGEESGLIRVLDSGGRLLAVAQRTVGGTDAEFQIEKVVV